MDAWVYRLKAAYDAGYYRTEAAVEDQSSFPWQNRTCTDCPFWDSCICRVHAEYRAGTSHTCVYFDPWNREAARALVQQWHGQGARRWWEWFNDQGATR